MNEYFILFGSCTVTKGKTRSLISDYGRRQFYFISNEYYAILLKLNRFHINDVLLQFDEIDQLEIRKFISFLLTEEFGHCTDDITLFPEKNILWRAYPNTIRNAIIEIREPILEYDKVFLELDTLGCQEMQLRFLETIDLSKILSLCNQANATNIGYLEVYIPYDEKYDTEMLQTLLFENETLSHIYIYQAPYNKTIPLKLSKEGYFPLLLGNIYFLNQPINCGVINYFSLVESLSNQETYFEYTKHNGCLNHKISIDANGEIKNCPSMKQSFGNIEIKKLQQVISEPAFTKMWDIKKDDIQKCNVCEFRYCCSDCRAYTEDQDDIYSKPLKCGYNPNTGVWL